MQNCLKEINEPKSLHAFTSNINIRRVLAGEFIVVNKY